jgi:formylglycine-generating enzyme required for sulfatase activity
VEVIAQSIVELLKKLRQSQHQTATSTQTTKTPKVEAPTEKRQAATPEQRPRPVQPVQESKPLSRLPLKQAIKVKSVWMALGGRVFLVALLGVYGYLFWHNSQSSSPNKPSDPSPNVGTNVTLSLPTFEFETATVDSKGAIIERHKGQAHYFKEDINGVPLEMVELPGGTFMMGTGKSDIAEVIKEYSRFGNAEKTAREWIDWEQPQHEVTLKPFSIGKYEVTQAQWRAVAKLPKVGSEELKTDLAKFKGDNLPVESVSWYAAQEFCRRLSRATGREYRLPSEAEWEYAARADTTTVFTFGPTITPAIVNYDGNYPYSSAPKGQYRNKTLPVGSLGLANAFGLFDMHGNVWEWCRDVWQESYSNAPTDGSAWLSGGDSSLQLLRGGSWYAIGGLCRAANRAWYQPGDRYDYLGFRVVVSARTP